MSLCCCSFICSYCTKCDLFKRNIYSDIPILRVFVITTQWKSWSAAGSTSCVVDTHGMHQPLLVRGRTLPLLEHLVLAGLCMTACLQRALQGPMLPAQSFVLCYLRHVDADIQMKNGPAVSAAPHACWSAEHGACEGLVVQPINAAAADAWFMVVACVHALQFMRTDGLGPFAALPV